MKRRPRLCSITSDHQADVLTTLANSRDISPRDLNGHYLSVYPYLVNAIRALGAVNREKVVLISHAIFGWMPTQLKIDIDRLDDATSLLQVAQKHAADFTGDDISVLAKTFRTTKGDSVVAAAKVLHFISPVHFPLWDKYVARRWGVQAYGKDAPKHYVEFVTAVRGLIEIDKVKRACEIMRHKVCAAGYEGNVSMMRLVDLILFLPPRHQ